MPKQTSLPKSLQHYNSDSVRFSAHE